MAKKRDENICPICEDYIDIIHSGYAQEVFVDNKTYREICFTCASTYRTYDMHIYTVDEMVQDGFNRKRAEKSVKAVKASVKRNTK
jgi:hypothetical protein